MFRFMRDCLAIAAILALCIWSLEPIALLPFGLCAAGLGIGALFMHIAGDFDNSGQPAAPARTQATYFYPQPTNGTSLSWNPVNWFSGWGADRHYGHNTHGHYSPSVFDRPAHAVVTPPYHASSNVHAAVHTPGSGPLFPPARTQVTVSSPAHNNNSSSSRGNHHGH